MTNLNNTKEPTLLIVDDEALQEVMLKGPIQRKNINVIFCQSGEESLNIIKANNNISLVLMDLIMPGMSGFQTMKNIALLDDSIPVIAVSASATTNDIEKAKSLGFEDTLLKPINVKTIAETFDKYANEKRINNLSEVNNIVADNKKVLRHLEESNNTLVIAFQQLDIDLIKQSLHNLRENSLIGNIGAIPMMIEEIQKSFKRESVSGAQILDLSIFIKQLVTSENNKLYKI